MELKQAMAGCQGHFVEIGWIPRRNDVAARKWIALDVLDDVGDLIDRLAIGRLPGAPLLAVDRAQIAVFIGPFVPDADAVFFEISDVRIAF